MGDIVINTNKKIILDNIYFIIYLDGEDYSDFHLDSKPLYIQEQYETEDVLSHEEKIALVEQTLDYFYNFWKFIETSMDNKQFTIYLNINLVMINIPISFYFKIKTTLESLKSVISTNVIKTYFKVEHKLAKYFLDIILTFYTPIKPIHII